MSILEVLMIVCFGVAWPIQPVQQLQKQIYQGKKSPVYELYCSCVCVWHSEQAVRQR